VSREFYRSIHKSRERGDGITVNFPFVVFRLSFVIAEGERKIKIPVIFPASLKRGARLLPWPARERESPAGVVQKKEKALAVVGTPQAP
jgi:hypothetical protein